MIKRSKLMDWCAPNVTARKKRLVSSLVEPSETSTRRTKFKRERINIGSSSSTSCVRAAVVKPSHAILNCIFPSLCTSRGTVLCTCRINWLQKSLFKNCDDWQVVSSNKLKTHLIEVIVVCFSWIFQVKPMFICFSFSIFISCP